MEPLLVVVVVATGLVAAGEGGSALRPSRPITNVVHELLAGSRSRRRGLP